MSQRPETITSVEQLTQQQFHDVAEVINTYKHSRTVSGSVSIQMLYDTIGVLIQAYDKACKAAGWDEERADEELGSYETKDVFNRQQRMFIVSVPAIINADSPEEAITKAVKEFGIMGILLDDTCLIGEKHVEEVGGRRG